MRIRPPRLRAADFALIAAVAITGAGVALTSGSRVFRGPAAEPPARRDLGAVIDSALGYLERTQVRETRGTDRFKGEWPTIIHTERDLRWLGVGPKGLTAYDSTVFTAASVHNILAELYLSSSEYARVRPMLHLAAENFPYYEDGGTYNFYPVIPTEKDGKMHYPRGSNHYPYRWGRWKGVMNIPNDADDSAVVFIAMKLQKRLAERYPGEFTASSAPPAKIGHHYARYRDLKRRPHPYNWIRGYRRTGAFLTWFMDEGPLFRRLLPTISEQRVPFKNDVDCVVNSNSLKALALYGELGTPGAADACRYVERVARRGHSERCGIYYPNRYYLHYVAAKAEEAGASCLSAATSILLRDLLARQRDDGSWANETGSIPDRNQSTAFALNALLLKGDPTDSVHRAAARKAADYLLHRLKRDAHGDAYWEGGVFFAASVGKHDGMTWRSDAYTTALVVQALAGLRAWSNPR